MDMRTQLRAEIETLEQQLLSLKETGAFLQGVRVEQTAAGGTASRQSKAECKYARLRAGKGKVLDNGKKSKYIPVQEIDKYRAMCTRGKSISRLERKIQQRQKRLR